MEVSIDGGKTYVDIESVYIQWSVYVDNEDEDPERRDDVLGMLQIKATDEGIVGDVSVDGYIDSTMSVTTQEFADNMNGAVDTRSA